TKAVSERFISAATCCIQGSGAGASSRQTAAGLPAKGRSVNESTWMMRVLMLGVLGSRRSLTRTASGTLECGIGCGETGAGKQCFNPAERVAHAPAGQVGKAL